MNEQTQEMKVRFFFIHHTDNLEGDKRDYICFSDIDYATSDKVTDSINEHSDGEDSYTPLYLADIETGEIYENYTRR